MHHSEAEMAVWGGRYRFNDTSVSRRDFSPPMMYTRTPTERISSAPAVTQSYWRPAQPLKPRDHFASPKPLLPGNPQIGPCPLGCPCNQTQHFNVTSQDNSRLASANHGRCQPYNPSYLSSPMCQPPRVFSSATNYHQSDLRKFFPTDMKRQVSRQVPGRISSIPPRPAIPVGWGQVDLTTVYRQHFPVPGVTTRQLESSYIPQRLQRSSEESPSRWETSYFSSYCKQTLHVSRGY